MSYEAFPAVPALETNSTSFFDLPREIRDMIYHHALVQERPIVIFGPGDLLDLSMGLQRSRRCAFRMSLSVRDENLIHDMREAVLSISEKGQQLFEHLCETFPYRSQEDQKSIHDICDALQAIPPLLAVCCAIRDEGRTIYYSKNVLAVFANSLETKSIKSRMISMGPDVLSLMKHIDFWCPQPHDAWAWLIRAGTISCLL